MLTSVRTPWDDKIDYENRECYNLEVHYSVKIYVKNHLHIINQSIPKYVCVHTYEEI